MTQKKKRLSNDEKCRIVELKATNLGYKSIAKEVQRPRSTIQNFLKRYRKRKSIKNRISEGRPRKITERTKRQIKRSSIIDPWKSSNEIKSDLELDISTRSIRRILFDCG